MLFGFKILDIFFLVIFSVQLTLNGDHSGLSHSFSMGEGNIIFFRVSCIDRVGIFFK